MKIRFLKPAQFELEDAVAWYDSTLSGLELSFWTIWIGLSEG